MQKLHFCLALLLIIGAIPLAAKHIIGGNIFYECLGNDRYRFEMRVYRDCNCTDCADYDNPAFVSIYRCGQSINCGSLRQSDVFQRINVNITSGPERVDAPDYPCLIPPDICVQQAIYVWEATLPNTGESYHISYSRCCRNETITNIINPDDFGATYTIEITPEAQDSCNSSPVFNQFPPTVVCAGAELVFDHSATDPDGDQILYEFCSPRAGGGPILSDLQAGSCNGVRPNPPCAPPYGSVIFRPPNYDASNPLGRVLENPITIDPNTGIIRGTPETIGQFVVGVCISEYRNGVLLSQGFRDFQFNVASCDPEVYAEIESDQVIGDQEYEVNSCGETEIRFINNSRQRRFIDFVEWQFEIDGSLITSREWEPTISFPRMGTYEGKLILNPNTACGDTANIFVNLFPDISADFDYENDSCDSAPIPFTDLSSSANGMGTIVNWAWNFGDGTFSSEQHPFHLFRSPGDIPVTLTVTDQNRCKDAITKVIPYFPAPGLIVIAPSTFDGCQPADIKFDNLSFPIDSTYDILWEFGDGNTSTDISPNHVYEQPGTYRVDVSITSPLGCTIDTTFNGLIRVRPSPQAGFFYTPEELSNIIPTMRVTDQSSGAVRWQYNFGDVGTSQLPNPTFTFPDTGRYEVQQIVFHPSGCTDTLIQLIDIRPEVRYFLPNAFTPNGDGQNDGFRGIGLIEGARDFEFTIWNRWGELIFKTSDPFEEWNGRKNNTGQPSPNGVYVVKVSFIEPRGDQRVLSGLVTLIR